ncbi:glycosyltransferase family 39 protein [Pontibacter locisalis]|uniref:Glycosyltransferase family 39 protein n=1 Tax=Pontibacter locisalis TaxID=1719035 RepID=A0ABW5IP15_9BACT
MPGTTKSSVAKAFTADAATLGQPQERYLIPLSAILFVAFAIRMLAAFFSKGYAFSDDHFDVITIAQGWLDGFPLWLNEPMPPRHSMLYVLIHYAVFYAMEAMALFSPELKMLVVRVIHGLYSLLIVYFGYRITERLSNKANARLVGLMLALVWFMPFMSVRNLVEMVCIPPYLAAFYLMLREEQDTRKRLMPYFWAGALFALAFTFRYHTMLFGAGTGLVLLYRRQWHEAFTLLAGFAVAATAIQGTIDIVFFDYPFHSIVAYFLYNTENAYNYSTGPVYRFALTILGFLVPPVSAFLMVGYFRTAKLAPKMFWGGLIFFVAHSLFPNKQERFILPLLPLIMMLGVIGWQQFVRGSRFWHNRRKLLAASWIFFWVLNLIAALGLAFTYTKKSRVAPLVYLSEKQDMDAVVLEFGNHSVKTPPLFYLNRVSADYDFYTIDGDMVWEEYLSGKKALPEEFAMIYTLNGDKSTTTLDSAIQSTPYKPDYVVVVGTDEMPERMERLHSLFPVLKLEHTITPSIYDRVLHFLNPRVHKDEHVKIYKVIK